MEILGIKITLDLIGKLITFMVILQGFFVSFFSWFQKTETITARFIFSTLISSITLTLLHEFLMDVGVYENHPNWLFLPIFYSFAFGPLLFFYVKAALYKGFLLNWKDIKHFMLPFAQFCFFVVMFFLHHDTKKYFWENDYNVFYGTFAYPFYLASFTLYTYFAYRFIRHRLLAIQHLKEGERESKRVVRLRQVLKVWYMLLLINSSFIVLNFLTEHFFHKSLYNNSLYLFFSEMSFVAMVAWLAIYGYYKVAKGLGVIDFLKKKISPYWDKKSTNQGQI